MQLTTSMTGTLLTATASIASAWSFIGYTGPNFDGDIVFNLSHDGTLSSSTSIPCVNADPAFNGRLSSLKWDRLTTEFCKFTVYSEPECEHPIRFTSRNTTVHTELTSRAQSNSNQTKPKDTGYSLSVECYNY